MNQSERTNAMTLNWLTLTIDLADALAGSKVGVVGARCRVQR